MGLVNRLLRREAPAEAPCPRCGTPAPVGETDCAACGWDMRESFHGETGSHFDTPAEHDAEGRYSS